MYLNLISAPLYLGQGFRGVQLFMHMMGLVEGLLEEEVMGMQCLSSRLVHLLNRLQLLSCLVGYILTSQETICSLHYSHLILHLPEIQALCW